MARIVGRILGFPKFPSVVCIVLLAISEVIRQCMSKLVVGRHHAQTFSLIELEEILRPTSRAIVQLSRDSLHPNEC